MPIFFFRNGAGEPLVTLPIFTARCGRGKHGIAVARDQAILHLEAGENPPDALLFLRH